MKTLFHLIWIFLIDEQKNKALQPEVHAFSIVVSFLPCI